MRIDPAVWTVSALLVVFEDLHWIDGETQALLDALVDTLGSARLLLLLNYRPEYQHAWGSKSVYSQVRLDALPAETADELLDVLLGDDPSLAPLRPLLVKRGNPFFLEETVRTLVEIGALAGEHGRYRLIHPVQAIQVPATVQVVLTARIDRLAAEDKRLLQTASVIGKDVSLALLRAIVDLPDDALRGGIDRLQAAEFLIETGLYPDLTYSFKAQGPAGEALRIADAANRPFGRLQASFGLGFLHLRRGEFAQAISVLQWALEICRVSNLRALAFHGVAAFLGGSYAWSGRVGDANALLDPVVAQTATMGAWFDHIIAIIPLGEAHLLAGKLDEARRLGERAVDVCVAHRERGHHAWALRLLGEIAASGPAADGAVAERHYRRALALADELGMRPLVAHSHLGLGKVYRGAGKQQEAHEHLTIAARMYREMGMTFWLERLERRCPASNDSFAQSIGTPATRNSNVGAAHERIRDRRYQSPVRGRRPQGRS